VKLTVLFYLLFSILIFIGCEEDTDTSPPTVYITKPIQSSVVSEITTVKCFASDNDSVKFVELWIDSVATGITDSSMPYEFLWNTVPFEDSTEHYISVQASDMNDNISDSEFISVMVDNSDSQPQLVNIISIDYTESEMTVVIQQSKDDDFKHYEIFRSSSIEGDKNSLVMITNVMDTVIQINNFDPTVPSWYWAKVEDIHGYFSFDDGYYVLDEYPAAVFLNPVNYTDSLFSLSWSLNNENDFQCYMLFESDYSDMSNADKIFEIDDSNFTTYDHSQIEQSQYMYYQVVVKDHWGLESFSNIQQGCSWVLFNNAYGDASYDYGRYLINTIDGGYIIAGNTSLLGNSYSNILAVKVNYKGDQEWIQNHTFSTADRVNSISELSDGSFVMVGSAISSSNGSQDILIFQTDQNGNIEWHQIFGSEQDEVGHSIQSLSNGSFIIVGDAFDANTGYSLITLMNVGSTGNEIWNKTYGGNGNDYGYTVVVTNDGGYAISGITRSQGDSNGDAWIIKTDINGNEEWNQTYGGEGTESSRSIKQTNDGGYIFTGQTNSFGSGYNDAYLVKTDFEGNQEWMQTYGGIGTDHGRSVVQTSDDGYIISGYTDSFGDSGFNFWLIKTDLLGNLDWQKSYGGTGDDRGFHALQAADGGYIITGYSNSNTNSVPDIILIKTDDLGNTN
tara:strand:+ start:1012 stop:3036 length:2025 start_codon:yes stop_codon:yes gene_type:complete